MKHILTILSLLFCVTIYSQEKIPFIDYDSVLTLVSEHESKQEYDKVLEQLNTISKNDSTYCSVLTSKSYYLIAQEKYDEAIKAADEGLSSNCDNGSKLYLLMNKGVSYANMDNFSKAVKVYDMAIELFPKNPKLWYNKGIALENLDDINGAIEAYQTAIIYNPLYRNAHLQLGNICYRQHLMAQALMCFNMSLLAEPSTERAFSLLKYVNEISANKNENEPDSSLTISDDDDVFEDIDLVLNNKIALNSDYEIDNKIDISLVKQNHALLEQLKSIEGNGGFWDRYYIPFYQWIANNGHFDDFTYTINTSIKNETFKKIIEKNESRIVDFIDVYVDKWYNIFYLKSEDNTVFNYYNGTFQAEGKMEGDTTVGDWVFYDSNGRVSSRGFFNNKGEREKEWTWYHDNGTVKEKAIYKNGELNGHNKLYYDNGKPYVLTNSKNDAYDGEYKYFIKRGGLKQKKQFKEGKLNGKYLAYFDVGESLVEFEADYIDGVIDGDYKEYYANGDLYSVINFMDNKRHGKETQYYWNKQISMEASYKNDALNGPYLTYHPNGNKKEVGQSVDGFFNGAWQVFYDDGTLNAEYNYNNGALHDLYKTYDTDGKLSSEFQYRKGEIISYKFYDKSGNILVTKRKKGGEFFYEGYHANGNKSAEGLYDISGGKIGEWKFYNTNGSLREEGEYQNDNPINIHKGYYESGDLETINDYDREKGIQYFQYFYKNGQLKSQGWYKNGFRHGTWEYYYIDGTREATNFFHNDDLHGTQNYYSVDGTLNQTSKYNYGLILEDIYYTNNEKAFETIDFSNFKKEHKLVTHYQNGNKEAEIQYVNNIKHGPYKFYNFYGNISISGTYHNGEMNGEWTWYYPNGEVRIVENYLNGNQNGTSKRYYENRQLENDYLYNYGNDAGKWLSYHKNGQLEISTIHANNEEHSRKEFYDSNGNLQLVRFYNYGELIGYTYLDSDGNEKEMIPVTNETVKIEAFYDNGNPSRVFEFIHGENQGDYNTYYYDGTLKSVTKYDKGETHGEISSYYKDGTLKSRFNSVYGYRNGISEKFYANGKLRESFNYLNGEKHGEAKYYDESGNLTKTELYANGTIYESN